jgi:hypothetical protein
MLLTKIKKLSFALITTLILTGCGNDSNYIPITTAQELINIRSNLSGNYRLMNDIDLESSEWTPIGTDTAPFSGTLDGKNHTISNLKITTPQVYVGLFGYNQGMIKNLNLDNVEIKVFGLSFSNVYAGAFIGYNKSVENLENLHTLSGELFVEPIPSHLAYVGGLIGFHSSIETVEIYDCSNQINILRNDGYNSASELISAGGLLGYTDSIIILDSYNRGFVEGHYAGGLVGYASSIIITNSYNDSLIEGHYAGGLVAYGVSTKTIQSYNLGDVWAMSVAGGLVGEGYLINVENSYNLGSISGNSSVGGLIGFGYSSVINKSLNKGYIYGTYHTGGLIGRGIIAHITLSFNDGELHGDFGSTGGLIGYMHNSSIQDSYNTGLIWGQSRYSVGGLIGGLGISNLKMINSFNAGLINAANNGIQSVGGLVGEGRNDLIFEKSINFGDILVFLPKGVAGSIIGIFPSLGLNIVQTFYSGKIIDASSNNEIEGLEVGTKVTDLSTFNLAFFTTTLGWDTEIWDFTGLDIANGVYPTLKNMPVVED